MKLKFKNLMYVLGLGLVIVSCSKNEENFVPELTKEEVKNIVKADQVVNDIFGLAQNNSLLTRTSSRNSNTTNMSCFTSTVIDISEGSKIKLDFGSGCDFFGKTYKGKLEIVYEIIDGGYKKSLAFSGFSIDGVDVEGSANFTILLRNNAGNFHVTTDANLFIKLEDGTRISREGNLNLEKVEGSDTPITLQDDIYKITGSWKSIGKDGFIRTVMIEDGLVTKFGCEFITKGIMKIVKGTNEYSLDFGDGTCDNKVSFTDGNGTTTELSI